MYSSTVPIPETPMNEPALCGTCNQDVHAAALLPSSGSEVRCPNPTHVIGWQRKAALEAMSVTPTSAVESQPAAQAVLTGADDPVLASVLLRGADVMDRIVFLERKRVGTKADLLLKFEDEDWHGVADAAMDLRDIDSELIGLRFGGGK